MSKRFPVPEFERLQYKNLPWSAPALLDDAARIKRFGSHGAGSKDAPGAVAVAVGDEFCTKFMLRGPQRHAAMCLTPAGDVSLVGRSYAWTIQRALIVTSLDAGKARVLADWTTPRPMNTRLGPEQGIVIPGGEFYLVCAHRHGDHWIFNRTLIQALPPVSGQSGFYIASSAEDHNNDFHACNVAVTWGSPFVAAP
jgi:hypothetical protein